MSLRKQTLWSMLPILVTSVVSIISVPIYFKVLGAEMYAMWFYVGTLTGAFGFIDLGIGVAVGRYMGVAMGANNDQAVREYWSTGHAIVLPMVSLFSLIFILIGTLFGPDWFKVTGQDAATLRWAMVWGGAGLFFSYYGQMWFVLSASKLDFRFLSIIRSTLALISTIGMIGVALLFENAAALVAYSAILGCIQLAILLHRGNTSYNLPVRFSDYRKGRLLEMLPYTLKTFAQLVSGSVLGSADRLMLGRLAPASDFAGFNVSLNIGSRIQNLSQAAMGPIFCNTTRGVGGDTTRGIETIYRDSMQLLFPWYGLVVIWVGIWHEPLVRFWLQENATAVDTAFPWIVAGCCLAALSNISGSQLGPLNRVGTGLFFSVLSSGSSLLFVFLGWHFAGITGAAAGFCLARLPLVFQDAAVRRIAGIRYGRQDLQLLVMQGCFGLICGGIFLCTKWMETSQLWSMIWAFVSGTICAAFILSAYLPRQKS